MTVVNVPGIYLHTCFPSDKKAILKLVGTFVDIMCSLIQNIIVVNKVANEGKRVKYLYVKLLEAVYECLESVL